MTLVRSTKKRRGAEFFDVNSQVWTHQGSKTFSKPGKVTRILGPYTYEIIFPNGTKSIYNQRNMKICSDNAEDSEFQEEAYESVQLHDHLPELPTV